MDFEDDGGIVEAPAVEIFGQVPDVS